MDPLLNNLSPGVVKWISPETANLTKRLQYPIEIIQVATEERRKNGNSKKEGSLSASSRTNFQDIVNSDLPSSEKTPERLNTEAGLALGAGAETTARDLAVIIYYLLHNKDVLDKLRTELSTVIPTAMRLLH